MDFGIKGKRFWITGGNSGVGFEIARQLKECHGAIPVISGSKPEKTEEAGNALDCEWMTVDVRDREAVFAAVERTGPFYGLFNSAGISERSLMHECSEDDARRMMDINYFGTLNCIQACAPHMLNVGGRIVNISSISGLFTPFQTFGGYAATKAAVNDITRTCAAEMAPKVTVNALCPGFIRTPMTEGGDEAKMARMMTIGRILEVAEVAEEAIWFCRAGGSGTTGALREMGSVL